MAIRPELRRLTQQTTTKPGTMSLSLVRDNLDLETTTLRTTAAHLASADPRVDEVLDIALQPTPEILVQCATTRENDVLVETAPDVDGALLDDAVDDDGEGRQEVRRVDLRVEEDLGGKEALVADVDGYLATTRLADHVLREAAAVAVEAGEFLHDIGANVTVFFFNLLGCLEGAVGLSPVSEQRLYEVGDVSAGDGDRLDGGTDDVTFGDGNDVRDTVTGVDDGTGQRPIRDFC